MSTTAHTPLLPVYASTEDFLRDLRTTLLGDSEALVDWQIRYSHYPELAGARFCFRVRLPDICGTDMADGIPLSARMVSGEPPDVIPEEHFDIEGMEDFCPITYLTFRKGLGCYAVDKVHLAARRLGLTSTQREILVTIADTACPRNTLYLALQAIFLAKEDQRIHIAHMQVIKEARAILDS